MDTMKAYFFKVNIIRSSRPQLWMGCFLFWCFWWMFFSSTKGINRLISIGISNIYLKVTIEKSWHSHNFDFLSLIFFSSSVFGELQLRQILSFKTSCCNLKIRAWEQNCEYPYISLNKNVNFNKNETEAKMENFTYSFRETNLVLQLI